MKILKKLFILIGLLTVTLTVNAATANISVSSSSGQVIVGNQVTVYVTVSSTQALGAWEYTLNYPSNLFKLTSSSVGLHYAGYASNANTKSVTYKYYFTALKSGSATFSVDSYSVLSWNDEYFTCKTTSKKVNVITYEEYRASLSSNNSLKSLSIDGYTITPEFNPDVLEYKVIVPEKEEKVKINATPQDSTAQISGSGEVEVTQGSNNFNILVTAQNGSEKTYKLTVEVIDEHPILVEKDGKKYSVVKVAKNLEKPKTYTETTVQISEYEIPAFYSEITEFTLVGLKDEEGNVELYIYNDAKYDKYIELTFGNITIYPLPIKLLDGYDKYTESISTYDIEVMKVNKSSRFSIINGLNVETKEEGLYIYDKKDNSLIKYFDDEKLLLEDKINMLKYVSIGFAAIAFILLITLMKTIKKRPKKVNNKTEDIPKNEEKNTKDNVDNKKEVKKIKKESKKKDIK